MSKRSKGLNFNLKKIKYLKIITIFCLVILTMELCFMLYNLYYVKKKDVYFDGVNKILKVDNYYVSVGGNNDNEKNYEKAKITKYNEKREKVWEKLYNKGVSSSFNSVCVDDLNFVAVGKYVKKDADYQQNTSKGLIVKYDKNGDVVWEKYFSDAEKSNFRSIKKVDDGYIVVGESLFPKENKSLIGGAYIIKFDKNGEILWQERYGNNSKALFNDFVITDEEIFVVGKNNENLGIIVKYDKNGSMLDEESYQGVDSLGFTGICNDDNSLYVVGGKGNKGLVVKYDKNIDILADKLYSSKEESRFNRVLKDENGNLVVIGLTSTGKKALHKGLIGKYDSDLKELAIVTSPDENDTYYTDVILDDKNYLVSGYSLYEDGYLAKIISYSRTLKALSET